MRKATTQKISLQYCTMIHISDIFTFFCECAGRGMPHETLRGLLLFHCLQQHVKGYFPHSSTPRLLEPLSTSLDVAARYKKIKTKTGEGTRAYRSLRSNTSENLSAIPQVPIVRIYVFLNNLKLNLILIETTF